MSQVIGPVDFDDPHEFAVMICDRLLKGSKRFAPFFADFYPATPAEGVFRWGHARALHDHPIEDWEAKPVVRRFFELLSEIYAVARKIGDDEIARRPSVSDDAPLSNPVKLSDTIFEIENMTTELDELGKSEQRVPILFKKEAAEEAKTVTDEEDQYYDGKGDEMVQGKAPAQKSPDEAGDDDDQYHDGHAEELAQGKTDPQ